MKILSFIKSLGIGTVGLITGLFVNHVPEKPKKYKTRQISPEFYKVNGSWTTIQDNHLLQWQEKDFFIDGMKMTKGDWVVINTNQNG